MRTVCINNKSLMQKYEKEMIGDRANQLILVYSINSNDSTTKDLCFNDVDTLTRLVECKSQSTF